MNSGETSHQNEDAQAENPWDILTDVPQNDGETGEKTRQFKKLEELLPIFNAENVGIYGHGTGSTGDSHEVVDSIFEDGLRAYESPGSQVSEDRDPDEPIGDTDLFSTSVCLHSTEGGKQIDLSSFRESLDHWPHRESRNVVLFRLPFEYFNVSPIHSEHRLRRIQTWLMPYEVSRKSISQQATTYQVYQEKKFLHFTLFLSNLPFYDNNLIYYKAAARNFNMPLCTRLRTE